MIEILRYAQDDTCSESFNNPQLPIIRQMGEERNRYPPPNGKPPTALHIEARNEKGEKVKGHIKTGERLTITPEAEVVDYVLR